MSHVAGFKHPTRPKDIGCWVAELDAALYNILEQRNKNIKYLIFSSGQIEASPGAGAQVCHHCKRDGL